MSHVTDINQIKLWSEYGVNVVWLCRKQGQVGVVLRLVKLVLASIVITFCAPFELIKLYFNVRYRCAHKMGSPCIRPIKAAQPLQLLHCHQLCNSLLVEQNVTITSTSLIMCMVHSERTCSKRCERESGLAWLSHHVASLHTVTPLQQQIKVEIWCINVTKKASAP